MVRKVYGGQATIKKDQEEEIHDKILKLPIPDQQRVIDILTTLQGHGDNQGLIEKEKVKQILLDTIKTGKFCKDDYDLLVKIGFIVPLEEGYKEKLNTQPETRTKDMIKQERKFQKERLYEFFNEMVNPMGEKYTDDFMKKHYNILYNDDLNDEEYIKRVDEIIDEAKISMYQPKVEEHKKGLSEEELKKIREKQGEMLFTPHIKDRPAKQYEERVRYRKASKQLGKETSYETFSQYVQWFGKTLGDMYNLYNLPTRLQGYILKSIYKHWRHGEEETGKINQREDEEKEMFNFEEFKELNPSNIQLRDLINNWIEEKDSHKKIIIEKYIKHYVDNYFPNQTEIEILIKHGIVVPEKITVKKNEEVKVEDILQEEKEQAEEKPHIELKSPEEKIGVENLKKPFLFYDKKEQIPKNSDLMKQFLIYGIKGLSTDYLKRLAEENPTYRNVILDQFIQGFIRGEVDINDFNKIKDYLKVNEPSQPIKKVIDKQQLLTPNRYKINPNTIRLK